MKLRKMIYQPYKWLIFAPLMIFSTFIFAFLAILLSLLVNQRIGSWVGGNVWARFNGMITPIKVSVTGKENIQKGQSYVIVSNHQSLYDVWVVYGWLGIDVRWVMKQELRKVPGIGVASEVVGHIFVDRSNAEASKKSIEEAKKRVVNGTSVVFFPEGTRSRDGSLHPFKKGAFRMAIDLNLPILPITIMGTKNILPSDSIDLMPGKVKVVIHKPISVAGVNPEQVNELSKSVKQSIASSLH